MTFDEEQRLIDGVVDDIDAALAAASAELLRLILAGAEPRSAVQEVLATFPQDTQASAEAALSKILKGAVGTASDVPLVVGEIALSAKLYAEAQATADVVRGIVQRHTAGLQDARALALELYEGYQFRPPAAEPLALAPTNERLPKYLREALLTDGSVRAQLERGFARLQVDGLKTPALRAAYAELLDAIDKVEAGAARALLERKLDVAFFERMRYFATRIARTELHRAYAQREAWLLMQDADVEFVQVRRAPGRQAPCICVLMTGRDAYGLGPGVYPKADAPLPPFHPHCMCVVAPRLDLTGTPEPERDDEADVYLLQRVGQGTAGRIVGSQAKAERVVRGEATAEEIVNASRNPAYRIERVGEVVRR